MKTFACAVILLLCYVFPAYAQQVAVDCSTPPKTFRHTWYIDPVNGQTEAAMTGLQRHNTFSSRLHLSPAHDCALQLLACRLDHRLCDRNGAERGADRA